MEKGKIVRDTMVKRLYELFCMEMLKSSRYRSLYSFAPVSCQVRLLELYSIIIYTLYSNSMKTVHMRTRGVRTSKSLHFKGYTLLNAAHSCVRLLLLKLIFDKN